MINKFVNFFITNNLVPNDISMVVPRYIKIFLFIMCCNIGFAAPIKITFWHSMGGPLAVTVDQIADEFNKSQSNYEVIPVFKGNYPETLMAVVAAFRAKQQPDIAQIFEVGTAMMTNPPGAVIPVYQLMQQAGLTLKASQFLPAIASYYSDDQGHLLALPFNSSTPVMFYNITAFKKAGLDPNVPPKTWPALEADSKKLLANGYHCGFTTGWPSWIQLEAFSAWHNIPFASEENGFAGYNPQLTFDNKWTVFHLSKLAEWQRQKIFVYGGREDNATSLFTSGECPMIMESSGDLSSLTTATNFGVGVGPIPYWPQIPGAPQNMLIGGAALWAMSGHSAVVNKGIAEFFAFLTRPDIQAYWQQQTGYLPVTKAAYELSVKQGFYAKNPGADIAIKELTQKQPTINSKGIRLGAYPQIRMINDQELEAVFSGQKTAQQALASAITQGDDALKQFADNIQ